MQETPERPGPWVRRAPGGGHSSPLQCSCLENPVDRGAWGATVHGVTKSWRWLSSHTIKILIWRIDCFLLDNFSKLGAFASKATCRGSSTSKLFLSFIFIIMTVIIRTGKKLVSQNETEAVLEQFQQARFVHFTVSSKMEKVRLHFQSSLNPSTEASSSQYIL